MPLCRSRRKRTTDGNAHLHLLMRVNYFWEEMNHGRH
nr:MAG TPA: hypothetical protein [Caudoviricetes sp.]